MKISIVIVALLTISSNAYALFGVENKYQHDADIFRLKHLKYYGELIEEFRSKTGKYPLQGKNEKCTYVAIAAPHQKKYVPAARLDDRIVVSQEDFRQELETGLNRKIDFKFDPQKVPKKAPIFYLYIINGDGYYFIVQLYNKYSFSVNVAKHYNQVEITNAVNVYREAGYNCQGLWKFEELLKDTSFKRALGKTPYKNAWFIHLEEQYK